MKRTLYFAFGSNMDVEQMQRRCLSAREVAPSVLDGYRFAYAGVSASRGAGVATVIKDPESYVEGMLYSITVEDLLRLDGFEGAPHWYQRKRLTVAEWDTRHREAWVYILDQPLNLPTREYHEIVKAAYDNLSLDTQPLDDALDEARESVSINGAPVRRAIKKQGKSSASEMATRQMTFTSWLRNFRQPF